MLSSGRGFPMPCVQGWCGASPTTPRKLAPTAYAFFPGQPTTCTCERPELQTRRHIFDRFTHYPRSDGPFDADGMTTSTNWTRSTRSSSAFWRNIPQPSPSMTHLPRASEGERTSRHYALARYLALQLRLLICLILHTVLARTGFAVSPVGVLHVLKVGIS